jgi:hypothetical protein
VFESDKLLQSDYYPPNKIMHLPLNTHTDTDTEYIHNHLDKTLLIIWNDDVLIQRKSMTPYLYMECIVLIDSS